jgi:colanic acid/amylovoran biosynthesis glycosyltransferase
LTGLLVPERDYEALAHALSRLLDDEDLWQRLHRGALQRVEQYFDLKTQTALLENTYNEVAAAK